MNPSPVLREELPELASAMATAPWIALDTEANSMFVYQERTCLIQLNVGGRLYLIDCLALDPDGPRCSTLAALKPVLEDSRRPLYLHGGEYDAGILKRDYGLGLAGVWDTQQAALLLGWAKTGYGSLVEGVCNVHLAKSHTLYDWGIRPLDPTAVRYALDDVLYLPQVQERLINDIREADLEEEHGIACRAVEESAWSGGFEPRGVWRVKGLREQSKDLLPLIYALYLWRDSRARVADRPAGRLVNDELLLALARRAPTTEAGLERLGLKRRLIAAHGESLTQAIATALAAPPIPPERPMARQMSPEERARERRLKDWRAAEILVRSEAQGRTVPPQVVLPPRALEYLVRHGAGDLDSVPQLGPKRVRLYGQVLCELCR